MVPNARKAYRVLVATNISEINLNDNRVMTVQVYSVTEAYSVYAVHASHSSQNDFLQDVKAESIKFHNKT